MVGTHGQRFRGVFRPGAAGRPIAPERAAITLRLGEVALIGEQNLVGHGSRQGVRVASAKHPLQAIHREGNHLRRLIVHQPQPQHGGEVHLADEGVRVMLAKVALVFGKNGTDILLGLAEAVSGR